MTHSRERKSFSRRLIERTDDGFSTLFGTGRARASGRECGLVGMGR